MKNLAAYVLVIYIFINSLFVFKYGKRLDFISPSFLILLYLFFICSFFFLARNYKQQLNNITKFTLFYWIIGLMALVVFIAINLMVDGTSLNVDRWSAMEVSIRALLNGEYPYMAIDHLGGRSSNFPGLFLIGIPFYLLGDVGFLQPFVFLCLLFVINKTDLSPYQKYLVIFLLIFSPAYLWEVYVKSDLMSNILIVLLFMIVWQYKYSKNYFQNPKTLGVLSSILVLTRGVVIIPLSVFLFKSFYKTKLKSKVVFLISFAITVCLLILPVILLSPDFESLKEYNPLELQTRHSFISLEILSIVLAFIISFKINNIEQVFLWSFNILCLLIIPTFIFFLYKYGVYESILNSVFDLSYLGKIIPFSIIIISQYQTYLNE